MLDEALGIKENQRISLKRAQIETYLASLSPYREVVKQTELIGGYRRSHQSQTVSDKRGRKNNSPSGEGAGEDKKS